MRNKTLGRKVRYGIREFAYTLSILLFLAGNEVGGWIQYAIREVMRYGSHAIREVYCSFE